MFTLILATGAAYIPAPAAAIFGVVYFIGMLIVFTLLGDELLGKRKGHKPVEHAAFKCLRD